MNTTTHTAPPLPGRLLFTEHPDPEELSRFLTEQPEPVIAKSPPSRVRWSRWVKMADGTEAHFSGYADAAPEPKA